MGTSTLPLTITGATSKDLVIPLTCIVMPAACVTGAVTKLMVRTIAAATYSRLFFNTITSLSIMEFDLFIGRTYSRVNINNYTSIMIFPVDHR
jgi:hypothetical protein